MKDPVSQGLMQLADGLRPWVVGIAARVRGGDAASIASQLPDAQSVLLFMWDHWNELFRDQLTFVERSLVSELREFRNRWAHQEPFPERDVFRFLDDADRLLTAIDSPRRQQVAQLRVQSLKRLYESEIQSRTPRRSRWPWWPLALCVICAATIDFMLLSQLYGRTTVIMSVFITLLLLRVGYLMALRQLVPDTGPRECTSCGRIIYTPECPYCAAARIQSLRGQTTASQPEEIPV